jgi:hypothetical protein
MRYQIYDLLLPQEESYGFATGTLIIREETVSNPEVPMPGFMPPPSPPCVTPEAGSQFKDAIADYNRLNKRRTWLLQREFQLEKPYEIVSSSTINILFRRAAGRVFTSDIPIRVDTSSCPPWVSTRKRLGPWFISAVLAAFGADVGAYICLRKFKAGGRKCPALPAT